MTKEFVEILRLIQAGDLARARSLRQPMLPITQDLFAEPNPGPLKALLAHQGLIHNELRAPMTLASPALSEQLVQRWAAAGFSHP